MSATPFMQLYVADYLGDTLHLTTEEHGAYLLLLMAMWRAGGRLPNDATMLARIAKATPRRWASLAVVVMPFFVVDGDHITQKRLAAELLRAAETLEKRSAAGKASAAAKALKNNEPASTHVEAMLQHRGRASEPDTREPIGSTEANASSEPRTKPARGRLSYPDDFEEFWKAYPVDQNMSKREALTAWSRLSDDDRKAAVASLPAYRSYCQRTADYRPLHACRYLSKRRFEGHLGAAAAAPTVRLVVDDKTWADRLAYGRAKRVWSTKDWGPMPGLPGCQVPAHLLAPGDGEGWAEYQGKSAA